MNTVWSTYVQKIDTLYKSRALRFSDRYKDKYVKAFDIDDKKSVLEIGCGPGAFSESLSCWYPSMKITGCDRDTEFIRFAREKSPHISYCEEDATALSFGGEMFDVTISNTVAEHIEPSRFYGEQYRVLKKGGVCLVLSARKGIVHHAPCLAEMSDFEKAIWDRASDICREMDEKAGVCKYPMTETEMPRMMEKYGFRNVSTEYLTLNMTPDNPSFSREEAHAIIESHRATALDGLCILKDTAGNLVSDDEIEEMARLVNARYDKRIALYDTGEKQWDTYLSLTMVLRGVKM
jgi:ubiquinone/menaquinone biosynthesis C-methylase UbiE